MSDALGSTRSGRRVTLAAAMFGMGCAADAANVEIGFEEADAATFVRHVASFMYAMGYSEQTIINGLRDQLEIMSPIKVSIKAVPRDVLYCPDF